MAAARAITLGQLLNKLAEADETPFPGRHDSPKPSLCTKKIQIDDTNSERSRVQENRMGAATGYRLPATSAGRLPDRY
ncbi:hypothetical protein A249_40337, partial [Pseudomonas syringae pv. actinidiae ICMP 18804]